jgi:2-iminobutanoate/2-iminopropanoate deaminase
VEKRTIDVPSIYEPQGQYNHAIVVSGGRTAYLSGVVGRRKDGSVPDGIVEQAEVAFDNLVEVMRACGGSLDDIVKVNIYVGEDFADHGAEIRAVRSRYLKADFPVSTLVQVSGYAGPRYLIEIEAIAVLPED